MAKKDKIIELNNPEKRNQRNRLEEKLRKQENYGDNY